MTTDALTLKLLESFLAESQEVAARITRDVLELERGPADDDMGALYQNLSRCLHNLKGSAATIALDDVAHIAHDLEEVVTPLARARVALPAAIADRLLADLDAIVGLVRGRVVGTVSPGPATASHGQDPTGTSDDDPAGWRVGSDRVRELIREVERLRELHTRLDDRRRQFARAVVASRRAPASPDVDRWTSSMIAWSSAIKADSEEASDIVQGLEVSIKAMCTQQVAAITDPLHRALRDLQRSTGKEARLSVVGAEMSLDRRLLDQLKPALVQLVRNAMDHGIEAPSERERAGKHREGLVVIRVEQRGNLVVVEVADDGRGLDIEAIRKAARRRGLASDDAIAQMSVDELAALVFGSGFSTREGVAAISGRGVGLDLVRDRVQALRGRIEVASVAGHGTRFTMTLPSTMGSSPVVLARCGEQEFVLPLQSVEGIVAANPSNVVRGHGGARLDHRGQLLTL
jgi:two-component system, chemotaxis family, sensor kinase CheA